MHGHLPYTELKEHELEETLEFPFLKTQYQWVLGSFAFCFY